MDSRDYGWRVESMRLTRDQQGRLGKIQRDLLAHRLRHFLQHGRGPSDPIEIVLIDAWKHHGTAYEGKKLSRFDMACLRSGWILKEIREGGGYGLIEEGVVISLEAFFWKEEGHGEEIQPGQSTT